MEKFTVCGEDFFPTELVRVRVVEDIPGFAELSASIVGTHFFVSRTVTERFTENVKLRMGVSITTSLLSKNTRAHWYTRNEDVEGVTYTFYGLNGTGSREGAFAEQIAAVM